MSDKLTYGRRPVVIVALRQPRCSNTFGVSPCTATGTPKCYQCYWTCLDRENYNTDASITWLFTRENDDVDWLYEETGDDIRTNAIPMLISASTTSSRLNVGSSRTGESPLGRRATGKIVVANRVWDDHVGDPYLADRPERDPVGFWALFAARNPFTPGFEVTIYEGYSGQALEDMQSRLLNLEDISGPDGSGHYTLSCRDPLDDLRGKNAQYPPRSQIELREDIDATQTTIPVVCALSELTAVYGNTGATRYLVIGDEIISYTSATGTAPNLTLTGVVRGVLNSTPDEHSAEDSAQRGAYHVNQQLYNVARYIIKDHTIVKDSYIVDAQWDAEGGTYLSTLQCTTFLPEPNDVEKVLGELGRDGLFSIWWDERTQTIPLLAVRPPRGTPLQWTDDANIETLTQETKSDERMTRVSVYFGPRDFLGSLTDPLNFDRRRIRIDAEVEREDATGGKIFENTIFSRWTKTFGNALLVGSSLLLRYRLPPKYITVTLDAKDNGVQIGDVVDLTTRKIRDTEGQPIVTRWQVIGVDDKTHASKLSVMMQSFAFIGKFAIIMANDAPNYADATDEEKLEGCWLADDATGKMPDGSEPYLLQ